LFPKRERGILKAFNMRVIARSALARFVAILTRSRDRVAVKAALAAWYHEVEHAAWHNSQDVKRAYASASIVDAERVVFNIKGNSYRLVAAIDYQRQIVFIKWLGTHSEYDTIDVRTVMHGDQTYQKR
jgi:mRNA interferase HigB